MGNQEIHDKIGLMIVYYDIKLPPLDSDTLSSEVLRSSLLERGCQVEDRCFDHSPHGDVYIRIVFARRRSHGPFLPGWRQLAWYASHHHNTFEK